jgi:hypothetical protein
MALDMANRKAAIIPQVQENSKGLPSFRQEYDIV